MSDSFFFRGPKGPSGWDKLADKLLTPLEESFEVISQASQAQPLLPTDGYLDELLGVTQKPVTRRKPKKAPTQ